MSVVERAIGLTAPHHDGSELYVAERPQKLGDDAVLRVRTPRGAAEDVYVRYIVDGEPRTAEAVVDEETDDETWWRVAFPAGNPVVRYRWLLSGARVGYRWLNGRGLHPHEVPGADDFALALTRAPSWHAESVVYEIFPDRFARGGVVDQVERPKWAVAREWSQLPEGRGRHTSRELYGGDLLGIEQRLEHIERLGANVVYLTPFFPARSTHRYDASSFSHVDPLLGGDDALRSLLDAAHARGLRVVGDLTLNHCGAGHEWFLRAERDPSAAERELFFFDGSPPLGYACWLDIPSLPTLNWSSGALRERMGAVFQQWLDFGLDGWRIDVANMVGRHAGLDLNRTVAEWSRSLIADKLLIAEHGHDYRPDLDGRGWHGAMNYAGFLRPVWWWLNSGALVEDLFADTPAPAYDGREVVSQMSSFRAGIPWDAAINSWSLLDSHDSARFRTVAGTRERHLVGVGLQMTLPGVPMVFAGDEVGLEGLWGEDGRRTIPWDDRSSWDDTLLAEFTRLVHLRRSAPALARGGLRFLHVSEDAIAYLRETRDERLLCLAARAPHAPIAVPFELETLYGEDASDGVLPSDGPAFHVWRIN